MQYARVDFSFRLTFKPIKLVICLLLWSILLNGTTAFVSSRNKIYNTKYLTTEFSKNCNLALPIQSVKNDIQCAKLHTFPNSFDEVETDYLYMDSKTLNDNDRPQLWKELNNPRDILALLLLSVGFVISYCNFEGIYAKDIYTPLQVVSICLGFLSGIASLLQVITGYKISYLNRRGVADDPSVNIYAGLYSLSVSWLALRACEVCPSWLTMFDTTIPWLASFIFVMAAFTPAVTLWNPAGIFDDSPELTKTELLRIRGLLAIGILGSVFVPDTLSFAIGGSEWWNRVSTIHTSQRILESSTALFALYATEASMISHRCAKSGVATFSTIVPAFAAVCLILAIIPCVAALNWLGDSISFFSFYRE